MRSFDILCLSLLISCNAFCQPEKSISNKDTYSWMFAASWILTDDDGASYNPFLIENLHSQVFPSRLTIDKYIYNELSKYGDIKAPGIYRKNTQSIGNTQNDKINFISRGTYNICPENSLYEGYFTEKIFQAFEGV